MHWNAAEAEQRAEALTTAGYEVEVFSPRDGAALRRYRESAPDAFVIDLSRLPSQGRAVATALRQQKATRSLPLVFAGGAPGKVAQTQKLLPDAVYAEWAKIEGPLKSALARPPAEPVVPGTMEGYAGTPLPKKLGIRPGGVVVLAGAPEDFERKIEPLPAAATLRRRLQGKADHILLFVKSAAEMEKKFHLAARCLADRGGLWIMWPKRSSGISSDLTQALVRKQGLDNGFVDYKICAVDETWSGLLFARRAGKGA